MYEEDRVAYMLESQDGDPAEESERQEALADIRAICAEVEASAGAHIQAEKKAAQEAHAARQEREKAAQLAQELEMLRSLQEKHGIKL